ncbi:MFS transporter [Brevibacillus sedimenti]|jgi:MFS family permease|uniref:MFS transporter n=1 Tax=Brevibacillus sedimenti TaxID=2613334 RepID=UPI001E5F4D1C|nr:MFS transporter [Anoxybacillus sediminis]UFJ62160.1 MFS transporter [Anoxybacillus sediminis]
MSAVKQGHLFKNKWFAIYFIASFFSKIGSQIYLFALPWLLFEMTGSVGWMSTMWAVEMLPFVLVGPFLGVFVDRWDRRKVLIWSDFARMILVCLIPLLYKVGLLNVIWLFVIGFCLSIFMIMFDLVSDFSVIPQLVAREQLTAANSLYRSMDNITTMLGPVIAGALVGLVGTVESLYIDGLSYLFTLIVVTILPITLQNEKARTRMTWQTVFLDIKEGITFLFRSEILWVLAFIGGLSNLAVGALHTVMRFYLANELHNALLVGTMYSVIGIMTTIGSVCAPLILKRMPIGRAIIHVSNAMFIGGCIMVIPTGWFMPLIGYGIITMAATIRVVYTFTIRQLEIPNEFMGRINAAFRMILTVSFPLSALLLGGLADAYGTRIAFMCTAFILLIVSICLARSNVRAYEIKSSEERNTTLENTI